MKPSQPRSVTPIQWLAVAMIWSLVAYGALVPHRAEAEWDQVHLIACR